MPWEKTATVWFRMQPRQVQQRTFHARLHLIEGLRPLHPELRDAMVEAEQFLCVVPLQIPPSPVLPGAHADLAQVAAGM